MSTSFSAMRKRLEDGLCESLKGRLTYFAARYRASHDRRGRVAVRLDGQEILCSDFFKWSRESAAAWRELTSDVRDKTRLPFAENYGELVRLSSDEAVKNGGFDQFVFYEAYHKFFSQSVDKSLEDDDRLVRMLAVFDRRCGKRRLEGLQKSWQDEPEWLRDMLRLRLMADAGEL